ncbi:MAG: SGNH/GDSL hydrolase family protein [Puniceicoccales bacterium]
MKRVRHMNPLHTIRALRAQSLLGFLALIFLCSWSQAENKVLFLGNSYTFGSGGTESVPNIFDALANATGQEDPTTVMRAVGGKDYKFHYQNSLDYVQQAPWTHVILQNYSTLPTHIKNTQEHFDYGSRLYEAIIANNPDTQVMLYMTWARAYVHPLVSGTSSPKSFGSTDEMLEELSTNYTALAEQLTAENPDNLPVIVNPVGIAWNLAGGNLPPSDPGFVDLFGKDNHHGNDAGYYLAACVHFASVYQSSPVGLFGSPEVQSLNLKIAPEVAKKLEEVAWEAVQIPTIPQDS